MQVTSDLHTVHELWRTLRDGFFLDEHSRSLRLSLTTHNPATASIAFWRFDIHALPAGSFRGTAHVSTAPLADTSLTLGSASAGLSLLLVAANAAYVCYLYIVQPDSGGLATDGAGAGVDEGLPGQSDAGTEASYRNADWGLATLEQIQTVATIVAGSHGGQPVAESIDGPGTAAAGITAGLVDASHGNGASASAPHRKNQGSGHSVASAPPCSGMAAMHAGSVPARSFLAAAVCSEGEADGRQQTVSRSSSSRTVCSRSSAAVVVGEAAGAVGEAARLAARSRSLHSRRSVSSKGGSAHAALPHHQPQDSLAGHKHSYGGLEGTETWQRPPRHAPARRHGWMAVAAVATAVGLVASLVVSARFNSHASGLVRSFHAAQVAQDVTAAIDSSEYLLAHAYHHLASPMRRLLPAKAVASQLLRRAQLEVVEAAHRSGNSTVCEVGVQAVTEVVEIAATQVEVPLWALEDDPTQVDRFAELLV